MVLDVASVRLCGHAASKYDMFKRQKKRFADQASYVYQSSLLMGYTQDQNRKACASVFVLSICAS